MNQLRQMKIGQAQAEQGRLNQLREIMPGVGAEAGLGPNAQKALALDPSQLANLMKIPKAERDRAKEQAITLGNLALSVLTAPLVQRAAIWGQARESAITYGANPQNVPEVYDQGTELKLRQWVAQAGQIKTLLDQVPDTPSGYRQAEGGLEFTPGGPADPAQAKKLAAAKRAGEGAATPAQQANNAEIDAARQALDRMNLDRSEILRRTQKSTNTGRENPDYDPSLERLVRTATQRKVGNDPKFNLFHRRYLGPAPVFSEPAGPRQLPPGVSAEQPGILDRIGEFFSGDDTPRPASDDGRRRGTPRGGGRVRGRSGSTKKAIPQMSAAEIKDLVDTKGESLTPAERKAIQARLDALGL
ncbi:MAG: hypothetical protein O7D96_06665 [SAR324 cluster bacterium]|nr:hypothetical protein [SAR324 cluster bacterium]